MNLFFLLCTLLGFCSCIPLEVNNQTEAVLWPMDVIDDSTELDIIDRVYGGQEVQPHAYPFQVGLSILRKSGKSSWCGGTIISEKIVLTAAHCLTNAKSVTVIMGMHNRLKNEPGRQEQTVRPANFISHKSYDEDKIRNDIALIKLNQALKFSDIIQPIALATEDLDDTLDGKPATVIGWGYYNKKRVLSTYLQSANSEIMSNSVCMKSFTTSVRPTNVCLDGTQGRGSCNGDSGGPLVVLGDKGLVQVGITSFGSGKGCDKRYPSVFTRITKYLSWIEENSV